MQSLIKQLKQHFLNTLNLKHLCLVGLFCFLIFVTNCGSRKPPLPPTERVVQRVAIDGTQIGNEIRIEWQMPARNASKNSLLNINRVDIYRLADPISSPLTITEEEFASRSTLIATVPINESDFALKEKTYIDKLQFSTQPVRLRYAIRFVNSSGQKAAFSNIFLIEPASGIASKPTDLIAEVSQDAITLKWTPPTSNVDGSSPANILGYNLYRTVANQTTKKINENIIDENRFVDEFFEFEKKYQYFIRAVSVGSDGERVESLSSNSIEITPRDTFPPSSPDSITVAAAPNIISIFFAINPEKDVVGYRIYRTTEPNLPKADWTLLTEDILKSNTYQDKKVEFNKTYYYYIIAVDKFGNKSQPSKVVSETAL